MGALLLSWGGLGARKLAPTADAVVLVDVLRFTTVVTLAALRGIAVEPHADVNGELLCPDVLDEVEERSQVTIGSVNGSSIAAALHGISARVVVASLLNAAAVADALRDLAVIALVPCGERGPDGLLRPSFEDLLGAGAVAARLPHTGDAAVEGARRAFASVERDHLADLLLGTTSGRELEDRGHAEDVRRAAALDSAPVVPRLVDGVFRVERRPV